MIGDLIEAVINLVLDVCMAIVDFLDSLITPLIITVFGENVASALASMNSFLASISHVWGWVVDFSMLPMFVIRLVELFATFAFSYWLMAHPIRKIVKFILDLL